METKQFEEHPGDRVGDLRTNLGMTKKGLSRTTGIDVSQITRIENGSLKTISSDYLIKLAKELKHLQIIFYALPLSASPKAMIFLNWACRMKRAKGL